MKVKTNQKALISLSIMLIGFIVTLFSKNQLMMLLQSGFESGLVGGLADWFAVSALFRYPFGIQIPHTALLPNNRRKITTALVSIVENNLLNKSSILNKLDQLNATKKFLNICKNNIYSNEVKSGIIHIVRSVISSFSITDASVYLHSLIVSYFNELESKKLIKVLTNVCLQHNYEQKILDFLVDKLEDMVKREEIKKEIGSIVLSSIKKLEVKGIMKHTLNTASSIIGEDKIGSIIQALIILILKELRNIDNSSRLMALDYIRDNIKNISNDENIMNKINEYKGDLANNVEFYDFIVQTLNEVQSTMLSYINDNNYIEKNILPFLDNLINKISADIQLINKLDQYIQEQVSNYINNNHEKIGKLIKENIEKLDNETLIELIEDRVGDDLQWIRVNGTICGFLIGLVLGGIRLLGV
jgi:uncharacterized membrane-anchored protein YjiN (DUF445 family)